MSGKSLSTSSQRLSEFSPERFSLHVLTAKIKKIEICMNPKSVRETENLKVAVKLKTACGNLEKMPMNSLKFPVSKIHKKAILGLCEYFPSEFLVLP